MLMFFDTETTGLPLWKERSADPRQPHVCELACILTDDDGTERASFDFLIKPDGWVIPPELTETCHGISTAAAESYGVPAVAALKLFDRFASQANIWVGHNPKFDTRMMRIMYAKHDMVWIKDKMEAADREPLIVDTAQLAKDIVKMAPTNRMIASGRKESKTPKLEECMAALFGETDFKGHAAGADARACMRIYFHIKGGGPAAPAQPTTRPPADDLASKPVGTQSLLEGI